jgi:signal transduction histidine kinase
LRKIVEEFIDNGFKFSNPGSKVKIEVKIDSDDVAFVVHDSGRGMTSEQINGISAFVQFERKIYEQQGSGLGLTIAKKLAEAHKGSLSIDSDPGKGTSIMVRLPRKAESV